EIRGVFPSKSGEENARKYIIGLLSGAERKNGWQLAEVAGEKTPYALQQFLYRGRWDANRLRDKAREYVVETIGSPEGVLVVDETGFLKQGKKSCGVKRQYSGTAGRIENCQVGVFITYASDRGHTMIDRALYLPQEWIEDKARRKASGIPEEVVFQTKPQMALSMLKRAQEADIPFRWVTGDSVYGDFRGIRQWCETVGKSYVLSVSGKETLWIGYRQYRVGKLLEQLNPENWQEASCGDGSKGARVYDWQLMRINTPPVEGYARHLLVRKSKSSGKLRAYVCFAPADTPALKLIETAGTRWTVEDSFAETKSQVGLDQYEVRSYDGWYKHITLACVAHALLTHISSITSNGGSFQRYDPANSSLEAFKRGRGLHV
ncbi:IS701 family transposase, partial [Eubacteriales bacterium OttesenSCG-928-A19]|nr:IS701 family transposase [Eubacteriales bacterium OttesenSCG-928-A19]